MFSEYASRFLAQSQSRLGPRHNEPRRDYRLTQQENTHLLSSRPFLPRMTVDPYQPTASQTSNFRIGSRSLIQPAPLFYSAADEFREDDENECEREIADFYALQKSRRHFGSIHLRDSSEMDEDDISTFHEHKLPNSNASRKSKGIRSSWRDSESNRGRHNATADTARKSTQNGGSSCRARENLFNVRLDDTIGFDYYMDKASSETGDDDPPSIQRFREQPGYRKGSLGIDSSFIPTETDKRTRLESGLPEIPSDSCQASAPLGSLESPAYDAFWGHLFLTALACLLATAFLVYLHTSAPSGDRSKWGDTVYLTIHGSFYLLAVYTAISILISLVWLALLRSHVRQLVYVVMFAVPVILYSFSLYTFFSSFKGAWHGISIQDKLMRWGSIVPFLLGSMWTYNVIRGRHAIGRAIEVLEFACRILAANIELLALGLGILIFIVLWTWIWMLMFTRVFLVGHVSESKFFINLSSWWLGAYFIIVYLWSLGVVAGIQRAVTAATVSQWYFHRLARPAPTSRQVVQAAIVHSLTALFGTICLSRLVALSVRLPFVLLPSRITSVLSLFAYSLVPTPIVALTDPLALTYGAIHSQPLVISACGLARIHLSPRITTPTPALHPRSWSHEGVAHLDSYRISKLILHAARLMTSLALGFGGWVSAARNLGVGGVRGSMYAYLVGLIAGTIGWSVLGAIEGIIADIVDASVICWSSETGTNGGEARYCREAGWLFGNEPKVGGSQA